MEYTFYFGKLGFRQELYVMGLYVYVRRRFGWWGYDVRYVLKRPLIRWRGFSANVRYSFPLSFKNFFKRFRFVFDRSKFVELESGIWFCRWRYSGGEWEICYLGRGIDGVEMLRRVGREIRG